MTIVRGISLSAAVRDLLIGFAEGETNWERCKRLQDQTLASIKAFRAGDRLTATKYTIAVRFVEQNPSFS